MSSGKQAFCTLPRELAAWSQYSGLHLLLTKGVGLCRHPVPFLLQHLVFGSPATWLCTSPGDLFIHKFLRYWATTQNPPTGGAVVHTAFPRRR